MVGVIVMTTGVGIFATFAGYIANKLLAPSKDEKKAEKVIDTSSPASVTLAELNQLLNEREKLDIEINAMIAQLGGLLTKETGSTNESVP
jgi:hypothetical protein